MAKSVARVPFKRIRERAAKRKGGDKVLASLMPKKPNNMALAKRCTRTLRLDKGRMEEVSPQRM